MGDYEEEVCSRTDVCIFKKSELTLVDYRLLRRFLVQLVERSLLLLPLVLEFSLSEIAQ